MDNKEKLPVVGGGLKKVLYTLSKIQRIGIGRATKALVANNTCKACGLGMGGQLGGMTNELGEFPAVCNKSVQAQSTDIQPPIPLEIFSHSIAELKELNERELASLGRLNTPLVKLAASQHFKPATWEEALEFAVSRLKQTDPQRSFFYSSGRSSNEAGFLLQLFARLYGTNNVNNCSFYCHQATSVGLRNVIGTGTSTVELADLPRADLMLVVGANPASNHPRLLHQLKACRDRGGEIVVINPAREPGLVKFAVPKSPASLIAGGTEIASLYVQPKIGSDVWLFLGVGKILLEQNWHDSGFVDRFCNNFDAYRAQVNRLEWPEIVQRTGLEKIKILALAEKINVASNAVFAWGMGLTHHTHGVDNVEQLANLALLSGMIGRPGAGLLPLRGHSNVQGIGTIGVKPVLAEDVLRRMEKTLEISLPRSPGFDTMAGMEAAARDEVDLAVLVGGNLFASNPDSNWAVKALDKINCKISLTTTLNRGHLFGTDSSCAVILPVAARDEEIQATTQESMFNFVRLSDGGIERLDNVKPESWVLSEFGVRVLPNTGVDFRHFQSHSNIRQAIAKIVPGLEQLADLDVARREFHVSGRLVHEPVFNTPDRKARFCLPALHQPDADALFPFTLTTIRSEGQFNSIVYEEEDVYRSVPHRWCILMNRSDMLSLQMESGMKVDVVSKQGEMLGLEVVMFDLPRGNCMAYYPEANCLTSRAVDPRSKTPSFKATSIRIRKSTP